MPSQLSPESRFLPSAQPPIRGDSRLKLRHVLLSLGLVSCGGGISERAVFSRDVRVDPCENVDAKAGPIFEGVGWARPPEPVDCEDQGMVQISDVLDGNGSPYCERYGACGEKVRMAVFSIPFDDPDEPVKADFNTDLGWMVWDASGDRQIDSIQFEGRSGGVHQPKPWDYLELRNFE